MSVRPSVCPSFVEKYFETRLQYNYNIPIDLKFALIIGGRVMHVWKERFFEIQIASCKFMQFYLFFVFTILTNLLSRLISSLFSKNALILYLK